MNWNNIKRSIRTQFPPEYPSEAGPALNSRLYEASPRILPIVTILFVIISAVLYYLTNFQDENTNYYAQLGYRSNWEILYNSPWGVISNAFFHAPFSTGGILHIGMNCLALMALGSIFERSLGSFRTFILYISFAIISGTYQLFASETINFLTHHLTDAKVYSNMGSMGLSGILYAIIGFMWGAWKRWTGFLERFNNRILKQALFWQILCFLITFSGTMPIGNTAHISGLVFGFVVGMWSCFQIKHAKRWFAFSLVMFLLAPLILFFGREYLIEFVGPMEVLKNNGFISDPPQLF